MKVAIAAKGGAWDSPVDSRFARAQGFVDYDSDTGEIAYHDNTRNMNTLHGAGVQASRTIVHLGTRVLITGHVGPKAFGALQAGGVQVCTGARGTVGEVIAKWKAGQFDFAGHPDVEEHWG